ncbi:MAG: DNA alkylation repair protein [Pseudomonadota bacterium]
MTDWLSRLDEVADPARAAGSAAYHKADRTYLGVPNPVLNDLATQARRTLTLTDRLAAASGLWTSDIHEGRILAAKMLTQARIRPDEEVWQLIQSWVPDFDAWAVADHACIAGQKRLVADPARLDTIAQWTRAPQMWTRRAALVITLPWAKQNHPKPQDRDARERILGWASTYVGDRDWFIQKAVAWWLRDLSKRDPDRVRLFLDTHGPQMKAFARKEAGKYLDKTNVGEV